MNDWQHFRFLLRTRYLSHVHNIQYEALFYNYSNVFLLRHATIRILDNELYNE